MNASDRLRYLIDRYISGFCTHAEMDELLDYIQQHPEDINTRDLLPDVADADAGTSHYGEGPEWADLQRMIGNTPNDRRQWHPVWWRVAACIALLIVVAGGFYIWPVQDRSQLVGNTSPADSLSLTGSTVKTARDEHRLIALPDGSMVWISGSSRIEVAAGFNKQTREVTLFGEAFFDIRKDESHPFVIQAGNVTTTVLGTAFNIRAFPEESEVVVTVARGKVSVQADNKASSTITANQQIRLNVESDIAETNPVDATEVTQWIKEDLLLQRVTLVEVKPILEEQYDVRVEFDNVRLKNCRFTATFFKNASLDEVMSAICLVNNATFEANDKVITIFGEGCP